MNLESFVKMKALESVYLSSIQPQDDDSLTEPLPSKPFTRRLQFDTTPPVYQRVEDMCILLGCTKREYLEILVLDGLNRTETGFHQAQLEAGNRRRNQELQEETGAC